MVKKYVRFVLPVVCCAVVSQVPHVVIAQWSGEHRMESRGRSGSIFRHPFHNFAGQILLFVYMCNRVSTSGVRSGPMNVVSCTSIHSFGFVFCVCRLFIVRKMFLFFSHSRFHEKFRFVFQEMILCSCDFFPPPHSQKIREIASHHTVYSLQQPLLGVDRAGEGRRQH